MGVSENYQQKKRTNVIQYFICSLCHKSLWFGLSTSSVNRSEARMPDCSSHVTHALSTRISLGLVWVIFSLSPVIKLITGLRRCICYWTPELHRWLILLARKNVEWLWRSCSSGLTASGLVRRHQLWGWPCRWRQRVPPKIWYLPKSPHDVATQKTKTLILTAVRTWNLTEWFRWVFCI
jgi:hypothetical protein